MVDVKPQSSLKIFIEAILLFNDYLSVFCFLKIFNFTFITNAQNISDWSKGVKYWPHCFLGFNIV